MNFASIEKSKRLQRVEKLLKDRQPHTTLDIICNARVCAVSAIISELRAQGRRITCKRQGRFWMYRMH